MKLITDDIIRFFQRQHFTIISTIDANGDPHSSCKGIVSMDENGQVYLLDLYHMGTFNNLKRNPRISITCVDEHKFKGYSLKGKAKIIQKNKLKPQIIKAWEDKISSRITQRVLRNIRGERGHSRHPEALLPEPKYLIAMKVEEIVDLTPHHLK